MGKLTKDEAIEKIRKPMIQSMKHGKLFVLYLGKIKPNFNSDFCGGPNDLPT